MGVDVVPRDDRAWPRSSLAASVVLILVALGSGVGLAFGAVGRGIPAVAVVGAVFVVAFGFGLAVTVPAMRQWIAGRAMPARFRLLLGAAMAAAFAVLGFFDAQVGWAVIAGLSGGLLVANVWAIRAARANRALVDRAEAGLAQGEAGLAQGEAGSARAEATANPDRTSVPAADAEPAAMSVSGGTNAVRKHVSVRRVLGDTVRLARRRAVAWLVAGIVVLAGCGVLHAPDDVTFVVVLAGGTAFLWVVRNLWTTWLALRDLTKAATPPRRAFVVLLHDPAPKMIRPLLGVWSDAPAPRGGRLPKPEQVYRCDDELDALECRQGSVVVHEAWVDTGPRRWSKPRWVAADAGIVLPHRRSVLGRWYMSTLISGERPRRPRPLTLQPPGDEPNDVIVEPRRNTGSFLAALAGRTAALAALGLLFYWIT